MELVNHCYINLHCCELRRLALDAWGTDFLLDNEDEEGRERGLNILSWEEISSPKNHYVPLSKEATPSWEEALAQWQAQRNLDGLALRQEGSRQPSACWLIYKLVEMGKLEQGDYLFTVDW